VLGHEPAGEVVTVGDSVDRFAPGDRVVVPFSLGDGTCPRCRQGHGNVCDDGRALGFEPEAPGAFAERVAVPDADYNLVERPPWLDATAAAALGCRYMTAYHARGSGLDSTAASGWPSTVAAASGSRQSNWATRSGHGSSRSMSTTTPSRSLAIWGPTRL